MGINCMSLAVWLGAVRKCSAAVVGLDLVLGLSMVTLFYGYLYSAFIQCPKALYSNKNQN